MNGYLVDTNVFLWFCNGDSRISKSHRLLLQDSSFDVFVSIASLWEIAIKLSKDKLKLNRDFQEFIQYEIVNAGFRLLPIRTDHLLTLRQMPFHHKDPFDRLIVAQSLAEKLPFLYTDKVFELYFSKES